MKQLLVISFALVIFTESLLPKGIGLSQDFKFGELIAHFQEHKDTYGDSFSFLDFLQMHYASDSKHKQQNHHDKLPCLDGHSTLIAISLPLNVLTFIIENAIFIMLSAQLLGYFNSYFFQYTFDFLNPPQA
jgi:hypothetical protein